MSDSTLLSSFIDNLNANVFLREFSFSQTHFTPIGRTRIELADHVVRIGDLLFLYQLKERSSAGRTTVDDWLKNKVVKKATRQIRFTLHLLNSGGPILVANERGHVFDLAAKPTDLPFRLVLFKSSDTRTPLPYPRFHRSKSVGFIHIFDALDYFGMCRYLLTATEIAEYLTWREKALTLFAHTQSISEVALVGQYMLEEENSPPSEHYAKGLAVLQDDVSSFDLSFLFNGVGDRIEYASTTDRETSHYPMLRFLARLARAELRALKERLQFVLKAVNENRLEAPVRFVSPALNCGFLLVPIPSAHFDSRLLALKNLSLLAKYDQRTTHQVSMSVSQRHSDYIIDWLYTGYPWSQDTTIETYLRESYPFRPIKTTKVPRYNFSTEGLRRNGFLADESDPRKT